MSNSIWKMPDQKPAKENHIVLVGAWATCLWYGGEKPEEIFWENVKRWAYLEDIIATASRAEQLQKAVIWLIGGDTGISSKTMCAALFGLIPKDSDMPHDAGDFGRCLRFIRFMPDGTKDIVFKKLSDKPEWVEIGKRWDELVDLYDQENWAGVGDILRAIRKECRQPRPNEIFIGF